jgi:hypothetical protein
MVVLPADDVAELVADGVTIFLATPATVGVVRGPDRRRLRGVTGAGQPRPS